jgi:hypothetical protein
MIEEECHQGRKTGSKERRFYYITVISSSSTELTINAPLILKMRDIIFFAGKLHNGPFQGIL